MVKKKTDFLHQILIGKFSLLTHGKHLSQLLKQFLERESRTVARHIFLVFLERLNHFLWHHISGTAAIMGTLHQLPTLQHIYVRRISQHPRSAAIQVIANLTGPYLRLVAPVYEQRHKHALLSAQFHLLGHITDEPLRLVPKPLSEFRPFRHLHDLCHRSKQIQFAGEFLFHYRFITPFHIFLILHNLSHFLDKFFT